MLRHHSKRRDPSGTPLPLTRRQIIASAAAFGASYAWGGSRALRPSGPWRETRERFPEGVASGDPQADSVILWTRCPATSNRPKPGVTVEVAEDQAFKHLVTRAATRMSAESDWTCRVLVGGLKPSREYWYRFIDANGEGSRIGRTMTAPAPNDARTVRFAFVSCQNCNDGAQNAYRRMIFEDEKAAANQRLDFVMHLGDFFYEIVWYPEDRPQGMYDRRIRDFLRYPTGEKIDDFHVPTDLADYRAIYRAYLHDVDIQDARARWPFVCMGDNHEFSWKGWQSQQDFGGVRPAQTRKVAANQAWFEYQPSRVKQPSGRLDQFVAPRVKNAPIESFDDHGLGLQADNLAAIGSMTTYRRLRFGRNVDLILTDNRTYRSQDLANRPEMKDFFSKIFRRCWRKKPLIFSMPVRPTTKGGRRRRLPWAVSNSAISATENRRNPCSAKRKRPGSLSNSAIRPRLGSCGVIRWARPMCAPTCIIFLKAEDPNGQAPVTASSHMTIGAATDSNARRSWIISATIK